MMKEESTANVFHVSTISRLNNPKKKKKTNFCNIHSRRPSRDFPSLPSFSRENQKRGRWRAWDPDQSLTHSKTMSSIRDGTTKPDCLIADYHDWSRSCESHSVGRLPARSCKVGESLFCTPRSQREEAESSAQARAPNSGRVLVFVLVLGLAIAKCRNRVYDDDVILRFFNYGNCVCDFDGFTVMNEKLNGNEVGI